MSSKRLDDLFLVLKGNRRIVDEQHALIERAITDTPTDRLLAEQLRDAATGAEWGQRFPEAPVSPTPLPVLAAMIKTMLDGGTGLHRLCLQVIAERETLAKALQDIRQGFDKVNMPPRTISLTPRVTSEPPTRRKRRGSH